MGHHNGPSELGLALADLNEDGVENLIQKALNRQIPPEQIIGELSAGITEVGERFRREEYFLSELIYAGEIFKKAMNNLQPLCEDDAGANGRGVVVMGTVQGDIHDLGKNIVITMLKCAGFEVVDVGVDAPAQSFVDAVVDSGARLVGMSMLITTAFDGTRETISAMTRASLRDRVKIMIGGSVTSEDVRREMGADFWGRDAAAAVDIAKAVYG
jgi:methylmalonyl-CoA mutase cobalamin-binding domain/chain